MSASRSVSGSPPHKIPNNLNETREYDKPLPSAPVRASAPAGQPAPASDGMDPPPAPPPAPPAAPAPSTGGGELTPAEIAARGKDRADQATALADAQAQQQHEYTMAMMRIQHQQAIQKIVIEAASSISKNAADISEFVTNKI